MHRTAVIARNSQPVACGPPAERLRRPQTKASKGLRSAMATSSEQPTALSAAPQPFRGPTPAPPAPGLPGGARAACCR